MHEQVNAPADTFAALPYAYGPPPLRGVLRHSADDFHVAEQLGFEPDGDGEHWMLYVRKRDANTAWVGERLAAHAGLPARAASWSGLKDRRAVTEQWFSVHDPRNVDIAWDDCAIDGVSILRATRHRRKLRRGSHAGNTFTIIMRNLCSDDDDDAETLHERLLPLRERGVPNYFGAQRFGRGGANLERAAELFAGRLRIRGSKQAQIQRRGLYLSAARSALFNRVLAARVADGSWDDLIDGEAVQLDGSGSFFIAETLDDALTSRLAARDIHPSGPLWGTSEIPSQGAARAVDQIVLNDATLAPLAAGLAATDLKHERRPLRLFAEDLTLDVLDATTARLHFSLPSGAFATTLLRELAQTADATATDPADPPEETPSAAP